MWILTFCAGLVHASLHYQLDPNWPIDIPVGLSAVSAVAFDPVYQEVYVLHRSKQLAPVLVFDVVGHLLRSWGGINETRMFEKEHGLFVQRNGGDPVIWITDSLNCTVQSFDVFGKRLSLLGSPGQCDHSLFPLHFGNVADVTADDDANIYIADGDGGVNNRVVKLDRNLNVVWSLGLNTTGTGPGQFASPHSIACLDGYLFVADRENNRTQILTDDGDYVGELSGKSSGSCQPQTSWSVRVDHRQNLLFLVDGGFQPGPPTQGRLIVLDVGRGMVNMSCSAVTGVVIGKSSSEPHEIGYDEDSMAVYVAFINDYPMLQRYVRVN